ncbi:hemolymph lipopolysaccharide-binding protein-like [Neodiprion pinetum]|uniref:hemolymph lipopolysaccharide-binding protein-like n=1 Tax=Neodiprion pinetum TaxID=441929 RepID=UPI001EDED6B6|nr:hemolymph lipopolysaccharide-binding protein-like [Neodiprion pinetum]
MSAMAIIFSVIQILFYATLTTAQQPAAHSAINWFYQPSFGCSWDSRYMPRPAYPQWNQPFAKRDDYTYTPNIGGYKVHTRAVPWNDARMTCEEEGGHLAILNSIAEAKVVTELFKKSSPITGSPHPDFASIGFHDLYREGQYVTIHGQTLAKAGFGEWADGQPDNSGGAENCGSLHKSGGLNDINCGTQFGFICELPIY